MHASLHTYTHLLTHPQTNISELGLPVLIKSGRVKTYWLEKWRDGLTEQNITDIANRVYLSVCNKSSHCHVPDSTETLLLVNTQFACDENAVFWECCCISLHALLLTCTCYMKGCCFHNRKISLETSSFIKSVSPAGSVHVLTTS